MVKLSMFKGCAFVFTILLLFVICTFPVRAIVDPLSTPNNKFGIHILTQGDLKNAADLVNSNGGEWGYVTLLIQDDDLDQAKWQKVFDKLRELKIIPLVRLATHPEGNVWVKPTSQDAQKWADFLNSLNWVVQNRYIILYNEPNQGHEWQGEINPQEYSQVVKSFHDALKQKSVDFFILPAGFDVAAPNSKSTMDATVFWQRMYQDNPQVFTLFDGWASHSYPNPDFSATPQKTGRTSITSYLWETNSLSSCCELPKNLPIFITETGWTHKEGRIKKVLGYTSEDIGNFFKTAYQNIWTDSRIVAITPFVLNFPESPFDHFSWIDSTNEFYPQHGIVESLPKIAGQPKQIESFDTLDLPQKSALINNLEFSFVLVLKNTGQSIWDDNLYEIRNQSQNSSLLLRIGNISTTKPGEVAKIPISLQTFPGSREVNLNLVLFHNNKQVGEGITLNFETLDIFSFNKTKVLKLREPFLPNLTEKN